MSFLKDIYNPFFKKTTPSTAVSGWTANTIFVANIKKKLSDSGIINATRNTLTKYIKSKYQYLPEESIVSIINLEIADIIKMAESGAINSDTIHFNKRQPFIDILIENEVNRILGKDTNTSDTVVWSNLQ